MGSVRGFRGPGRSWWHGLWPALTVVLLAAMAIPALASAAGPGSVGESNDPIWVYDPGVGRYGGWHWDAATRRWVLLEVRDGTPNGSGESVASDGSGEGAASKGRPPEDGRTQRPAFFVDCRSGDDAASGTRASPWRTPAALSRRPLPARAVVFLQRGCAWDGQVTLAGEEIALAAYGEGEPPTISARDADREAGAVVVESPGGLVTGIRVRDTAGAGIKLAAQGATAYDLEVTDVAFGVRFTAPHTVADQVRAHDLHLFTSTPTSQNADDDSGAVGFNVESTDVTVQNCACFDCRAPSADYGHDGGFVEIWREGDRLRVLNNIGDNVEGFLEIGGIKGSGDAVDGVLLQGNKVARVHARAVNINLGGQYDIPVRGMVLRDNVMQVVDGPALVGDTSGVDMDDSNRIGRDVPPPVVAPSGDVGSADS